LFGNLSDYEHREESHDIPRINISQLVLAERNAADVWAAAGALDEAWTLELSASLATRTPGNKTAIGINARTAMTASLAGPEEWSGCRAMRRIRRAFHLGAVSSYRHRRARR